MHRMPVRILLAGRRQSFISLVLLLAAALPAVAVGQVASAPPSPTPARTPQAAGTPPAALPLGQPGQSVTLSGRVSVLYGDPVPGRTAAAANQRGTTRYYLTLPGRPIQLV